MSSCCSADAPELTELADIIRSLVRDPNLELSEASTPDDVPGWDSMTHIALIVEAECRFGVRFHTAEIEELRSIGELIRHIRAKRIDAAA